MSNSGLIRDTILKKRVAEKLWIIRDESSCPPPPPPKSLHKENRTEEFHFK